MTGIIVDETKMAVRIGAGICRFFDSASFIVDAPDSPALLEEEIFLNGDEWKVVPSSGDGDDEKGEKSPLALKLEGMMTSVKIQTVLQILKELGDKLALKEEAITKVGGSM